MPWVDVTIWHGTSQDAADYALAISHNCACQSGSRCGAHAAMLDQRFIDGILFARHLLPQLRREEFACRSPRSATWRSQSAG